MISKKSVIYRFLCIWWVLINMAPRNSDGDRGVDSDSDNASTSRSRIDSDGYIDFDSVVIRDRESDHNSCRHSYCYSDSG